MKRLILAAAALAVPLFTAGAQAAAIQFTTPLGGTSTITGFDFDPNNAVAVGVPAPGTAGTYTQLFQARVNLYQGTSTPATLDANGLDDGIATPGGYELTIVLGYTGTISSTGILGFAGGSFNYFQLFYQDASNGGIDSNSTTGQGFNDGRLILSGKVTGAVGSLLVTSSDAGPLDQNANATTNYPGLHTVGATGSIALGAAVDITGFDPTFFTVPPNNILIGTGNSLQSLPFTVVDPSQQVVNGATPGTVGNNVVSPGATYSPNLGPINGAGPDIIIQTDANATFALATVPAPQSAAAGLGLMGLVGAAGLLRRRRLA
jgi:hypothetical protein